MAMADAINSTNPKDMIGRLKPGIRRIPPIALLEEGIVMEDGADRYEPFNWQDKPIQASIYYDAMMRHLLAWFCGQDVDPNSKSRTQTTSAPPSRSIAAKACTSGTAKAK